MTDENAKIILNNTGITQNIFSKNIEQIGLRIGDIVKDYELDEYGNPVPVNVNDLSIIFKRGPNTSGKDLNGKPLPNLSNYHLGMIKPLIFNQRLY